MGPNLLTFSPFSIHKTHTHNKKQFKTLTFQKVCSKKGKVCFVWSRQFIKFASRWLWCTCFYTAYCDLQIEQMCSLVFISNLFTLFFVGCWMMEQVLKRQQNSTTVVIINVCLFFCFASLFFSTNNTQNIHKTERSLQHKQSQLRVLLMFMCVMKG